jgi:hypothetical protein
MTVVWRLRAARIPGEPALDPPRVEVAGPAGEDLVHVRLMAGVEDDRVAR